MTDIYNCQVGVWYRRFLRELFHAVFALRGRVNFTNLARFSRFHEQTYRQHFKKAFQWVWFNLVSSELQQYLGFGGSSSHEPGSGRETVS